MATRKTDTTIRALILAGLTGLVISMFCAKAHSEDWPVRSKKDFNFKVPLLGAGIYVGSDKLTTKIGLSRGGVELNPQDHRAIKQTLGFYGADLLSQVPGKIWGRAKWAPWVVRGAELIFIVKLSHGNLKDRRGVPTNGR